MSAPCQTEAADLIVVTGGRTGDPLGAFGGTIIDEAAAQVLQPVTVLEVLDRAAGVRAFEKGGAGGASYLSIRGGEPNFTSVLLDGIRVNDPTNSRGGAFDLAQIDPSALEAIEIARGALSAVHGADALSGVVSLRLRTFKDGERHFSARATGDTRGGIGASSTYGAGWEEGGLLLSGSFADSGDLTAASDLDRRQIFGRATQDLSAVRVSAVALHSRTARAAFPEDSGGPRLAVTRDLEERHTALTAAGLVLSRSGRASWQPRLSLSWMQQDDTARTPPIAPGAIAGVPGIVADSRFERLEAILDHRLAIGGAVEVAFGTSYLRDDGEATGVLDVGFPLPADFAVERTSVGGFGEATVRPWAWMLAMLGVRYDDPSSAAAEWTGRAAIQLALAEGAPVLFASWSEGYKLPSLYALAYPIIANPGLRPERSVSYQVGLEKLWSWGPRSRIVYFHNRFKDLIDFDAEAFTNVNRSRVTTQGVEAEVAVPLPSAVKLSANLTYLDTDQPADAPPLRSRPEWQGFLALDWQADERLAVQFGATYTSDFYDSSVPTGLLSLDERVELTAAATYRLNTALSLAITARNFLSSDYEDAVGFPGPGRVVRASLILRP